MKARISQLHNTEAEWLAYSTLVLEPGELAVYDPDDTYSYSRIKVGDGKRTLSELDFFIDSAVEELLKQIRFSDVIDGGRITEYAN